MLNKCSSYGCNYASRMSPALNGSSEIQYSERSDAIEKHSIQFLHGTATSATALCILHGDDNYVLQQKKMTKGPSFRGEI